MKKPQIPRHRLIDPRAIFWLSWAAFLALQATTWGAHPLAGPGPPGQAEFGTVKGRLVWGGDHPPPPTNLVEKGQAPRDADVCARDKPIPARDLVVDPKSKGVAYGFAYIVRPKGSNPDAVQNLISKAPKVELDQKNCAFEPYVLPMHQDQVLVIKSTDPKNHNVRYSAFNNGGFNQIIGPGAQMEVKLKADRFPIELRCDIHPWMKGYMMVFDHPFFTTTASDGSFEIKGVPAGDQNLIVWQETVGYVTPGKIRGMPVKVKAGEVTDVRDVKIDPEKAKAALPKGK
ncbi:MAG: hypothetical protein ACLQIB_10735 [Isosphaeraceae bacterium]